jgi:3-hydroxyacyl-CoA dehydrogenase
MMRIESAWTLIQRRGHVNGNFVDQSIELCSTLPDCVADAQFVQESVFENLSVKRSVLSEIDR